MNDLTLCEQEPIHSPAAIQPHGAVLAVLAASRLITHASANLAAILGRPAEAVLGRPLHEAIGATACHVLLDGPGVPRGIAPVRTCCLPGPHGSTLRLNAHPSGRHVCVDIERIDTKLAGAHSVTGVRAVVVTFEHATKPSEL